MKNKAIFLDRDGTIIKMFYNKDLGIIDTPLNVEQVEFVPGIIEFLKHAKSLGFLLILISNQPGVGINKISLEKSNEIKNYIDKTLQKEGAELNGQYYCMHHPYASIPLYKKDCTCRKPKNGLFTQAAKELNIDLKQSWMIGDGVFDIIAGHISGCKTILIGNLMEAEYLRILEDNLDGVKPTYIVKNAMDLEKILTN